MFPCFWIDNKKFHKCVPLLLKFKKLNSFDSIMCPKFKQQIHYKSKSVDHLQTRKIKTNNSSDVKLRSSCFGKSLIGQASLGSDNPWKTLRRDFCPSALEPRRNDHTTEKIKTLRITKNYQGVKDNQTPWLSAKHVLKQILSNRR